MKIVTMKKSGKRLALSDRRAALFVKMGIARVDEDIVVKSAVPSTVSAGGTEEEPTEPEEEPTEPEDTADDAKTAKPKTRKQRNYKRRDMQAEEPKCRENWKRYSSISE